MGRKRPTRKVRVEFRQNRQSRRRSDEWTRQYHAAEQGLEESRRGETVRAKGDLSRKRTILVDQRDAHAVDESQWLRGTIVKVHGLIAFVRDEAGHQWECTVRRVLRTLLIESRSPVTVGDRVWISDQAEVSAARLPVAVIERVEPRVSTLSRRDARKRQHLIVANAEQLLAVISIAQPRLRPHLVDRYIVTALKGRLAPVLCFNKVDLLDESLQTEEDEGRFGRSVRDAIQEFRDLGYTCLATSAVTGAGLDDLRAALKDRVTVLSGQSGVGKSTLINAIQPGLNLRTREVSEETEKGRHTTSHAELLPLDFGGFVVDTPGIRAFDLWSVEPGELEAYFVEFVPFVQQCRFNDCSHRYEDGCAVIAAVESGEISERRHYSYLKMFDEV